MPRLVQNSTTGANQTITLTPPSGQTATLGWLAFSYDDLISGLLNPGTLKITIDGVTVLELDVQSSNWGIIEEGFSGEPDDIMVISMSGITGLKSKLSIRYNYV